MHGPPTPQTTPEPVIPALAPQALEKRGRAFLLWSFLLCPCHLPISLGVLAAVAGTTSAGVVLRDHIWIAGTLISVAWLVGTGYGLRLIRQADKAGGACATTGPRWRRRR